MMVCVNFNSRKLSCRRRPLANKQWKFRPIRINSFLEMNRKKIHRIKFDLLPGFLGILAVPFFGCSYTLQTSKNAVLEQEGISKIYIEPIKNETFVAGVENRVYNELVKVILSNRLVKIVPRQELADATLSGTVTQAAFVSDATTSTDSLQPLGEGESDVVVATQYQASLLCSFQLKKNDTLNSKKPQKGIRTVWGNTFSRKKIFPANTQLGVLGTTSAIINASEFDRALGDLAESMMGDVHESLLAMF